jgi:hypothetical protein
MSNRLTNKLNQCILSSMSKVEGSKVDWRSSLDQLSSNRGIIRRSPIGAGEPRLVFVDHGRANLGVLIPVSNSPVRGADVMEISRTVNKPLVLVASDQQP